MPSGIYQVLTQCRYLGPTESQGELGTLLTEVLLKILLALQRGLRLSVTVSDALAPGH